MLDDPALDFHRLIIAGFHRLFLNIGSGANARFKPDHMPKTGSPNQIIFVIGKHSDGSAERTLFRLMRTAQDELAEMQHIRDGIIKYPTDQIEHLDGFAPYAIGELDEQIEPIRALYFYIENEPLTKTRIR